MNETKKKKNKIKITTIKAHHLKSNRFSARNNKYAKRPTKKLLSPKKKKVSKSRGCIFSKRLYFYEICTYYYFGGANSFKHALSPKLIGNGNITENMGTVKCNFYFPDGQEEFDNNQNSEYFICTSLE